MKIKICLLLLVVALLVSGCAITRETKREVELVDAVVTGVNYTPARTRIVIVGKTTIPQRISAKYQVMVEYEGLTLSINDEDLYKIYENRIGDTIQVKLVTIYYENGDLRQRLERSD